MAIRLFPSQLRGTLPRRFPRGVVVVLLALQALVWGGGSIVEARAAAESLVRYSHVEDQGTTACPPIHSHLDCIICRTLHGGATGGTVAQLFPQAGLDGEHRLPDLVVARDRGLPGTLGSRGPPLA